MQRHHHLDNLLETKLYYQVLSCKTIVPAPPPSEARINPLNLVLPAKTAPVAVTLTAFTSDEA